jgi:hypothetical protein
VLRAAGGPPVVILTNGADPVASALADGDAGVRAVAKPFSPAELGAAGAGLVGPA